MRDPATFRDYSPSNSVLQSVEPLPRGTEEARADTRGGLQQQALLKKDFLNSGVDSKG
jgi:hypothetical protein